ncbi:MAG: fatty acid desaturase family protein [Myxococcota bacterium]
MNDPTPIDWRESFTKEEIKELRQHSDWHGWLTLVTDYGMIAASMALVAYVPNVWTVLLALVVIGTRQLGLAVILHEASHRTLFNNRKLNDWVGNWLAAYPIYISMDMYRPHHLDHHGKTWGDTDPDRELADGFPVSKASMARKVLRDLLGVTGLKQLIGTSYVAYRVIRRQEVGQGTLPMRLDRDRVIRMVVGTVVTNAVLFGVLWALGHPLLYLLWFGAWLTTNKLVVRLRSMAEHSAVPSPHPGDPFGNTRTTLTSWWERVLLAPHHVGYHLEHHLVITIPYYKLPRFHRMLGERGLLDNACVEQGYVRVLGKMIA